jgi:hypothetical protein
MGASVRSGTRAASPANGRGPHPGSLEAEPYGVTAFLVDE